MNPSTQAQDSALEALYEESVQHERDAWTALQSHPPGSIGRTRAWEEWSRAIMLTNQSWRRLSAQRLAHPEADAPTPRHGHVRA